MGIESLQCRTKQAYDCKVVHQEVLIQIPLGHNDNNDEDPQEIRRSPIQILYPRSCPSLSWMPNTRKVHDPETSQFFWSPYCRSSNSGIHASLTESWTDAFMLNICPVLGLAGCHTQALIAKRNKSICNWGSWLSPVPQLWKLKCLDCRYASGRLPMHHQRMWASSLAVIPQTLSLPPACPNSCWSFASVQTFHTHAPYKRGFFE